MLFLTGSNSPADVARARAAGGSGYVTKDRIASELVEAIYAAALPDRYRDSRYPGLVVAVAAAFQVLVSICLVTLVLMHSGRDTGFGGLGFTPASQGGQHIVERNLTRLTVVVALIFTANSILLFELL